MAKLHDKEVAVTQLKLQHLSHEACDAFWKYWEENGETHKHGYYEATWGAINAAIKHG